MANKSRMRLGQITGSFSTNGADAKGSIITQAGKASLAQLNVKDLSLSGSLSAMASAIQRIHGKASGEFANNDAGEFYQAIKVIDGSGITLGAGGDEFSITESSDHVTIKTLVSDKNMIFKVNDGGADTEVYRLVGEDSAILVASGKELRFADDGEKISGDGTDLTIASGGKINLTSGEISTVAQITNRTLIDNNANALSFDAAGQADILKIDTSNGAEKVVAHKLDVTNDITVGGNLTVNGTTTTLDVTNLNVEDPFIFLGDGNQSLNSPTGIIFSSGSDVGARPQAAFGKLHSDSNGTFALVLLLELTVVL